MSRYLCLSAAFVCFPSVCFGHGSCGKQITMQTGCKPPMMQMTCIKPPMPMCGPPRMITTSMFMPPPSMQTTTLRRTIPQQRSPLPPRRFMPPITQRMNFPTPLVRWPVFQPLLRLPQLYTGIRWPVQPVAPVYPRRGPISPLPQTPQVTMQKPLPDTTPTTPKPLRRTLEEQMEYSQAALQRGLTAEGEGNYPLARHCYRSALIYPLTPAGRNAAKTLKRVETILEHYPHLADASTVDSQPERYAERTASRSTPSPLPLSSRGRGVRGEGRESQTPQRIALPMIISR